MSTYFHPSIKTESANVTFNESLPPEKRPGSSSDEKAAQLGQREIRSKREPTSARDRIANDVTYDIEESGKIGLFEEARAALERALNGNQFAEEKEIFYTALQRGIANIGNYNRYISVCGEYNMFEEAKKTYDSAIGQKIAKISTHNRHINVCGKAGFFEEAKSTFDLTVKQRIANSFTYFFYIDVCGRRGHLAEVKRAFDMARKEGLVDINVSVSYREAVERWGQPEEPIL
jgi:tetratricopeptide (TPR) repeat protein